MFLRIQLHLTANHHGESHVQHGHPCAEDPGRGSGFDQGVSCSLEGAWVDPWDPCGETLEGQNLKEQMKRKNTIKHLPFFNVLKSFFANIQHVKTKDQDYQM